MILTIWEIAASALYVSHSIDPGVKDTIAAQLDGYSGHDLSEPGARIAGTTPDRIRSLRMPVLIVNGEHDPRRAFGDALCAWIPGARRAIIGASGQLGSALRHSFSDQTLLVPSHAELDISAPGAIDGVGRAAHGAAGIGDGDLQVHQAGEAGDRVAYQRAGDAEGGA